MATVLRALNHHGDLHASKILESVGVAINTELDLYICLPCGSAHVHSYNSEGGILGHLQRIHSASTPEVRDHVIECTHGSEIATEFPSIQLTMEPRPAFDGITVHKEQFGCPSCPYAASSAAVVKRHLKEVHNDTRSKACPGFTTQVLNGGALNAKAHIRVVERPLNPPPSSAIIPTQPHTTGQKISDLVTDFDANTYCAEELPNSRMISPWLLRTGWHKHLEPYRAHDPELIELASVPYDGQFPCLYTAVSKYFSDAGKLIDKTNEVVLQKLNSADPDKE
jgi:hypothetical protein